MTQNQLQYWANQEVARSNLARETETHRSNVAREIDNDFANLIAMRQAAESARHNRRTEKQAVDDLKERIRYQKNRNATDYIKSISGALGGIGDIAEGVGSVATLLTVLGL